MALDMLALQQTAPPLPSSNNIPPTNPALLANLIARVLFAILGTVLCYVPFRLLSANGEFAAAVLIVTVAIMNFFTVLNSLIWNSDDWSRWWDGQGLCDIEVYLAGPLQTIYAASIFAVMHRLARHVRLSARVGEEKRMKRYMVQGAIIFSVPFVQLLFTYFDLAQRYVVGTLVGCSAVYDNSLPKIFVYDVPPAAFALAAVPYAYLIWKRFRAIARSTLPALVTNATVIARANRTRRRLYNMCLSILVVYLPLMVYFLAINISDTLSSSYHDYDYGRIHFSSSPYPWNSVLFIPSWIVPSAVMNQPWIPIATTVAIVVFFGMTGDAKVMYRGYAKSLGLDRCLGALWKRSRVTTRKGEQGGSSSEERTHSGSAVRGVASHGSFATSRNLPNNQPPILPTVEPTHARHQSSSSFCQPEPPVRFNKTHTHKVSSSSTMSVPPVIPPRRSSLKLGSSLFRGPSSPLAQVVERIRISSLPSSLLSRISSSRAADSDDGVRSRDVSGTSNNRATFSGRSQSQGQNKSDFAETSKTKRKSGGSRMEGEDAEPMLQLRHQQPGSYAQTYELSTLPSKTASASAANWGLPVPPTNPARASHETGLKQQQVNNHNFPETPSTIRSKTSREVVQPSELFCATRVNSDNGGNVGGSQGNDARAPTAISSTLSSLPHAEYSVTIGSSPPPPKPHRPQHQGGQNASPLINRGRPTHIPGPSLSRGRGRPKRAKSKVKSTRLNSAGGGGDDGNNSDKNIIQKVRIPVVNATASGNDAPTSKLTPRPTDPIAPIKTAAAAVAAAPRLPLPRERRAGRIMVAARRRASVNDYEGVVEQGPDGRRQLVVTTRFSLPSHPPKTVGRVGLQVDEEDDLWA